MHSNATSEDQEKIAKLTVGTDSGNSPRSVPLSFRFQHQTFPADGAPSRLPREIRSVNFEESVTQARQESTTRSMTLEDELAQSLHRMKGVELYQKAELL